MKRLLRTGILLPLLAGAAMAQTVVTVPVVRINPILGVPLSLPHPAVVPRGYPLAVPMATLALQPRALPAVIMDARRELPAVIRSLPTLDRAFTPTATPAKAEKAREALGGLFDGSRIKKNKGSVVTSPVREEVVIGIPERELEAELGL